MSPEQCRGLSTIDRRADIYALGCVMFEMATGRHVFVKEASGDLLVAHIIETPPRVSAFRPEIPTWMDDLVDRMLAKGPDDRPSSMDEIVSAMESFLQVGAAEFGARIPPTSALARIPTPRKRSSAPAAFSPTATPARTAAPPPRSVAPARDDRSVSAPSPRIPAIGGTQILPESGPRSPTSKPTNESTFRRSASELISEPVDPLPAKRKAPLLAVAAGAVVLAGVAAVFLTQNKPAGHRPAPPVEPAGRAARGTAAPAPPRALRGAAQARARQGDDPRRLAAGGGRAVAGRRADAPRGHAARPGRCGRTPRGCRATSRRTDIQNAEVAIDPARERPACRSSSRRSRRRRTTTLRPTTRATKASARRREATDPEEARRRVSSASETERVRTLARPAGTGYRAGS